VNGRFLLDTNIIISLFAKDPQIHDRIANVQEVFVPCIAIGELYFGAYRSLAADNRVLEVNTKRLRPSQALEPLAYI
jgi:tRNA(fMet)-specific endonuclease VapC